jgi:protein-L-isoaspartate(D-aspartate) O-methyltransferase
VDQSPGPELYAIRRRKMVERQIEPRGVQDRKVLETMTEIPREIFVDEALRAQAYADNALPLGHGQTISQPYIVARMTEMLNLNRKHRVLEVGTGTGYQTALLARMARHVFSIERIRELALKARTNLEHLGFDNISLRVGDGTLGWPDAAPFDRILVAAGSPEIPTSLINQLSPGGRLVLPVGTEKAQVLTMVESTEEGLIHRQDESCVFVRLIGQEGWPDEPSGT